jgi:tetratricopeptide (TPR) repeat protein/predicted Ser/Thr protein kinase
MHPEDPDDSEATRQGLDPSMMETQAGEVAARLPEPQGPARIVVKPRRTDPEFPVKDWDRYTLVGFLGQGGMGKVFLARDKRLGREVAIKFVRVDDDRYLSRFMGEARTQARVDHPHVCKVFEVGEVEGKVFIAMQHIKGLPLDAAALRLTVEQKAMVLRDAALGLHEAHRMGIIHRDIKPSNILVEQDEDGLDHAYVMDFGLAHEWNTESTETGSVLGTPSYMSPEQARGEVSRLDRRSDVYSLGATLYHALSGHSPVEGTNALEILSAVSSADPKPFRALKLDIPKDLEAITLKCLEKDRSRRYDSAKALAEDLDRFLAGDPVLARPTGLWYRLQRKARKHKQLTAVVLGALVLVLVAGGFALKTRREADRREVLARRFTEAMARIESMARYSALSPPHDIRPDLQAVRDQMERLRRDMAEAGRLADGPGHYALGWGYWTLDDGEQAREHLQMAWDAGYREPRVAYALSLAMGQLYREQLLEAQRLTSPAQRKARLEEVAANLRTPLLNYLRVARSADLPSPRFLDAQIAFAEGRTDEALALLKSVGVSQPWFYEAPLLQGSLFQARAWDRWNRGDRSEALADFQSARSELEKAATVARSGAGIRVAQADLEVNVMLMEKYSQGTDTRAFARGMSAVGEALGLHPDYVPGLVVKAALLGSEADLRSRKGEDASPLAREAVAAADRAVAAGPFRADARKALGYASFELGDAQAAQNLDPSEALRRGLQAFEGLSEAKRDGRVWLHLGLIHQTQAEYDTQRGRNPAPELDGAIGAFRHAASMDGQAVPPRINLGTCLYQRAMLPEATHRDEDLKRAQEVLEEAHALNPQHFVPLFVLAKVRLAQGSLARARGEDPVRHFQASLEAARQSIAINASVPNLHLAMTSAAEELAREAWDQGGDPRPWLDQALQSAQRAVVVAPRLALSHNNRAEAFLIRARWYRSTQDLAQAEAGFRSALTLAPGDRKALANLGRTLATRALWTLEGGGDPMPGVNQARRYLDQALRADDRNADAWQFLGECLRVAARWELRQGGKSTGAEAEQALRRALALAPTNQDPLLELGRLALAGAGSKVATLETLDRMLQTRPRWAEARAIRGALRLGAPQGGAAGEDALEDLAEALKINSNLRAEWGPTFAQARAAGPKDPRP